LPIKYQLLVIFWTICSNDITFSWRLFHFDHLITGDEIYDFVIEILEKWDININNVHVFVHDNAADMGKAFHHRSFESVSCTSHTLQLVIYILMFQFYTLFLFIYYEKKST